MNNNITSIVVQQGSHRLEQFLKLEGFLEKYLKKGGINSKVPENGGLS